MFNMAGVGIILHILIVQRCNIVRLLSMLYWNTAVHERSTEFVIRASLIFF